MSPPARVIVNKIFMILVLSAMIWSSYNFFVRSKTHHPMSFVVARTPHWMSCGIPYVSVDPNKNNCEYVHIDGWSIGHFLVYLVMGMIVPGHLCEIIVISFGCEAIEYQQGFCARWIIDPMVNVLGYLFGSYCLPHLALRQPIWNSKLLLSFFIVLFFSIVCLVNTPAFLKWCGKDFSYQKTETKEEQKPL